MLKLIKRYSLPAILLLAAFLRLYRLNELLGFWYDQGRDALVIWDFIHKGKFFLIGPTTGIEGVFRGPWYYWLITPFYWLGKGNPLWPSVFLILTSVFAIFVLYKVGKDLGGEKAGLLSAFIASVSVYIIGVSRWLSNPTPMLLIGISLIWVVFKFLEKKVWALPLIGFLTGMALQFGSATEYFYIPALLIILVWKRKLLPNFKIIFLSIVLFGISFIPQILFELRHPGVLTGPVISFLLHGKSSDLSFIKLISSHLQFFYNLIALKFWENANLIFAPFFVIILGFVVAKWKKFKKDDKFIIVSIFGITPFLGMLFFRGNSGNIYDYYFTGYYLVLILLFSLVLIKISETRLGKYAFAAFLVFFIYQNAITYFKAYSISLTDHNLIAFKNQLSAVDWIYKDAGSKSFNVDVYVPPVIPYAYQYLLEWRPDPYLVNNQVSLLYTLHEVDSDHPDRIDAWMARQELIGKIEETAIFGGITVERRQRLNVK